MFSEKGKLSVTKQNHTEIIPPKSQICYTVSDSNYNPLKSYLKGLQGMREGDFDLPNCQMNKGDLAFFSFEPYFAW